MNWHSTPVNNQHQVDLDFSIELGLQARIRKIVVLGNEHTRLGVIRRELAIRNGQPLSQDKLIDSQNRISGLGVFNQVQTGTQDVAQSQTDKTVLVAGRGEPALDFRLRGRARGSALGE